MPRALSGTAASAGERELYVTIQQLTEGSAASNFPTEAWTQLTKVWARRDFVTMDERMPLIADGAVAIDDGAIVAIGPRADILKRYRARETVEGKGRVLMPGLINGTPMSRSTSRI